MKKNKKDYARETAFVLGKECGKVVSDGIITSQLLTKYQSVINETIEKYGYKGKNFKSIYLPVIISMALDKLEKLDKKEPTKTFSDMVTDLNKVIGFVNKSFGNIKWN